MSARRLPPALVAKVGRDILVARNTTRQPARPRRQVPKKPKMQYEYSVDEAIRIAGIP